MKATTRRKTRIASSKVRLTKSRGAELGAAEPAMNAERSVRDMAVESMCGIHLSLGAKHGVYDKPTLKRRHTRYHVDVFAQTESVTLGGDVVFRDGAWCV